MVVVKVVIMVMMKVVMKIEMMLGGASGLVRIEDRSLAKRALG